MNRHIILTYPIKMYHFGLSHVRYFLLFSPIIFVGCTFSDTSLTTSGALSTSGEVYYQTDISSDTKAELAKNRRKEIRLIRKGDYFVAKNNPEDALIAYLEVLERLPEDHVVEKKIAHAYYESKDWKNAFAYFVRVPFSELKEDERKKMFHALFFDDLNINPLDELQKFSLGTGELEYYRIIDSCSKEIETCLVALESYSGSFDSVKGLKNTITQAAKISPDPAYRNFSVATEFYVQGEYRVAYELSKQILQLRNDYFDVQKLAGFSLFSLGRYGEARGILRGYIEHVSDDTVAIIRLGEIAAHLKDYAEANLYLNNAILAGYSKKTDLERTLAYNYSQLGDTAAMIKVLSYLLTEKDVVEDDFAVAISLAFARGENARAYVWAIEGLKQFPSSTLITPLYMTSLRIMGRGSDAVKFVSTLTGEILNSPLIVLELGINAFDNGEYPKAKEYFTQVYDIDNDADFGVEAENYIKQIDEKERLSKQEAGEEPPPEKKGWWF